MVSFSNEEEREKGHFIAVNSNPLSNIFDKIKYSISNLNNYRLFIKKFFLKRKKSSFFNLFKENFKISILPKIKYYDHHLCHIASAFYPSKFKKSLLISADGFGDFASTVAAVGDQANIKVFNKVLFPHSLGIFYQAFTQFLGFKNYGDEYKVMGLSAYGKDNFKNQLDQVIKNKKNNFHLNLNFFQNHAKNINMKWNNESPKFENLYNNNLTKLFNFDFERNHVDEIHMDLAKSVQNKFEELILSYIGHYKNKFEIDNLSLSGGCAMNSLANGRIVKELKFKNIYIPPAPGDAGGAIGAAILCNKENFGSPKSYYKSPYLGSKLNQENLSDIINKKIDSKKTDELIKVDYIKTNK